MKLGLLLGFAFLFAGCSTQQDDPACSVAETQVCACDAGEGTQSCVDGEWGECVCPIAEVERPPCGEYRYLRIDDLSGQVDGPTPGANIDAILVERADGRIETMPRLEAYELGVSTGEHIDPSDALGPPDSVLDYTEALPACDLTKGFVSLGGSGYLVARMSGCGLEIGDHVVVVQVGGCDTGDGIAPTAVVQVQMSPQAEPGNQWWISLGSGEGAYSRFEVTELPIPGW